MSDNGKSIDVTLSDETIMADGSSKADVSVEFSGDGETKRTFTLDNGSFSGKETKRELTQGPDMHGRYEFSVYAPESPGRIHLSEGGREIATIQARASLLQEILFEWIPILLLAAVLQFPLRAYVVEAYWIPSGSMLPTLEVDDRLLANKFTYQVLGQPPEFGDIIIFRPPGIQEDFIKRVIGLPGDEIRVEKGVGVYRNGELLDEEYVKSPPNYNWPEGGGTATVPEDKYFVLGDNRPNSKDSHRWGYLPEEKIQGEAMVIYWPPTRIGSIPGPHIREGGARAGTKRNGSETSSNQPSASE